MFSSLLKLWLLSALDTCGFTESPEMCDSAVWLTLLPLLLSGHVRLCVCLSSIPFFHSYPLLILSSRPSVHPCFSVYDLLPHSLPAGLWIRVGRAVLDPHQGPVTAGVALALVLGQGQVAATAFEAWCRGAARPGAGRRSRITCMPEACGLASELRMMTWEKHEGLQWAQERHGVDITEVSLQKYHS